MLAVNLSKQKNVQTHCQLLISAIVEKLTTSTLVSSLYFPPVTGLVHRYI